MTYTISAGPARTIELTDAQVEAVWRRVDRRSDDECWPWTGHLTDNGYGLYGFNTGGKRSSSVRPYRVTYSVLRGAIPAGLTLDHLCRNPACCNPAHLEPVTQAENTARAQPYRAPVVGRGASIVERPRMTGGSSWRVMFRKNGKQVAITFRDRSEAEAFVALCDEVGTVAAHRTLMAA